MNNFLCFCFVLCLLVVVVVPFLKMNNFLCFCFVLCLLVVVSCLTYYGMRGLAYAYEVYDCKHATDDICTVSRKEFLRDRLKSIHVTYFSCTNGDFAKDGEDLFENTKIGQKYNVKIGSKLYLISKI